MGMKYAVFALSVFTCSFDFHKKKTIIPLNNIKGECFVWF
jgi:hypothetical protein